MLRVKNVAIGRQYIADMKQSEKYLIAHLPNPYTHLQIQDNRTERSSNSKYQ